MPAQGCRAALPHARTASAPARNIINGTPLNRFCIYFAFLRGEDPCTRTVLFQASYLSCFVPRGYSGTTAQFIGKYISLRGVMLEERSWEKGGLIIKQGGDGMLNCCYWVLPKVGQSYKVVRVVLFCDCISQNLLWGDIYNPVGVYIPPFFLCYFLSFF